MEKSKWGWKLKYMIVFLWIFLFSCKARQHEEQQEKQSPRITSSYMIKILKGAEQIISATERVYSTGK